MSTHLITHLLNYSYTLQIQRDIIYAPTDSDVFLIRFMIGSYIEPISILVSQLRTRLNIGQS